MRLVEGVVRERQQDLPQRLDRGIRVAVGVHAGLEALVLLVELGLLLLAHRAAQDVGLAEAEAGDALRDRHDLLLVDDQAVAGVEDVGERLGELRVDRRDLLLPVLAQRVVDVRVRAHRARPVQRDDGRDVLEVVGLHAAAGATASARRRAGTRRACRRARAARTRGGHRARGLRGRASMPRFASMLSSASLMIVRLRSPRKSILMRPRDSHAG